MNISIAFVINPIYAIVLIIGRNKIVNYNAHATINLTKDN